MKYTPILSIPIPVFMYTISCRAVLLHFLTLAVVDSVARGESGDTVYSPTLSIGHLIIIT